MCRAPVLRRARRGRFPGGGFVRVYQSRCLLYLPKLGPLEATLQSDERADVVRGFLDYQWFAAVRSVPHEHTLSEAFWATRAWVRRGEVFSSSKVVCRFD